MIDATDIIELIGYGLGAFGIGFVSGFLFLTFKRAAGVLK